MLQEANSQWDYTGIFHLEVSGVEKGEYTRILFKTPWLKETENKKGEVIKISVLLQNKAERQFLYIKNQN